MTHKEKLCKTWRTGFWYCVNMCITLDATSLGILSLPFPYDVPSLPEVGSILSFQKPVNQPCEEYKQKILMQINSFMFTVQCNSMHGSSEFSAIYFQPYLCFAALPPHFQLCLNFWTFRNTFFTPPANVLTIAVSQKV